MITSTAKSAAVVSLEPVTAQLPAVILQDDEPSPMAIPPLRTDLTEHAGADVGAAVNLSPNPDYLSFSYL